MPPKAPASRRPYTDPHKPLVKEPQAAIGLSVGCFAGAGYGLTVGVGNLRTVGNTAVVTPSFSVPFAYDGAVVGAFCGVTAGVGFGSAIALHIGYHWKILSDLFPREKKHDLARVGARSSPLLPRRVLRAPPLRLDYATRLVRSDFLELLHAIRSWRQRSTVADRKG